VPVSAIVGRPVSCTIGGDTAPISAGLTWAIFLAGIVAWGCRVVGRGFVRAVNLLCGGMLSNFGARLLWDTLGLLL
jgi:hypothetical protein